MIPLFYFQLGDFLSTGMIAEMMAATNMTFISRDFRLTSVFLITVVIVDSRHTAEQIAQAEHEAAVAHA